MAEGGLVAGLMFPAMFALIFLGAPVAFALMATSLAFGWLAFGDAVGVQLLNRLLEVGQGFLFATVPMFVLMGAVLERSGLAERLFLALQVPLGRVRGGVALAAMAMGGIFAAATGIIGAVEVVVGLMVIPVMLRRGYDKGLIAGTVTSAGSLGTIIPPSVLCVVYGSVGQLPVTDLFAGCLLPGLLMLGLFMGYIWLRCRLYPAAGPPAPADEIPRGDRAPLLLAGLLPPALLIAAVLGSILAGVASPTEAGAVGAAGVLLLAAANRRLGVRELVEAGGITLKVTSFIMFVVLGGTMFSGVFYVHGGRGLVEAALGAVPLGTAGVLASMLLIVFAMGFVLDWATIVLVTVPLFAPAVGALGVDPLWFAVLVIVTLQTSYLTPPMAPALFYLRSIAPPEITYGDMVRGVAPFIGCQLLTLALVAAFPALATWLPRALAG